MLLDRLGSLFGPQKSEQDGFATKDELAERQKLARLMLQKAGDASPVQSGWQALARAAQGIVGGMQIADARREDRDAYAEAKKREAALFGGVGETPATTTPAAPVATGGQPMQITPASGQTLAGIDDRYDPNEARKELAAWNENGRPDTLTGLNDQFVVRKAAFLEDNPFEASVGIRSGYRSPDRQAELWNAAVQKYGSEEAARKWVAPPGKSQHNHGNAVDLSFDDPRAQEWAQANAARYGLAFPMKHEPWHVELAGARGQQAAPVQTAQAAPPVAERSFGRFAGKTPEALQTAQAGQSADAPAPAATEVQSGFVAPGRAAQTGPSVPALMGILNDERSSPGAKAAAQFMLQKKLAADAKDPTAAALQQEQLKAAQRANREAEGATEQQIIGGNLYERRKGSGEPWKLSIKKSSEEATPKRSLVPIYGQNEAGETVLLQPDDAGNANQMKLPPGVKIASGVEKIDTGTEFILMDRKTGQVVGRQAKDVAGKEAQEVIGQSQGKVAAAAPSAVTTGKQSLKEIDEVMNHKNLNESLMGGALGMPGVVNRRIYGTEAYGLNARIEQLKGRNFLGAFDQLRGGGAITEMEGAKAEKAQARLDAAQSEKDFREALKDLREILQTGMNRARQMGAKFGTVQPSPQAQTQAPAQQQAAPGGFKIIGVQ